MNAAEFKAWFEGFTEAMDGKPNRAQWERIKERVSQIDGMALTIRELRHSWPQTTYTWKLPPAFGTSVAGTRTVSNMAETGATGSEIMLDTLVDLGREEFNHVETG